MQQRTDSRKKLTGSKKMVAYLNDACKPCLKLKYLGLLVCRQVLEQTNSQIHRPSRNERWPWKEHWSTVEHGRGIFHVGSHAVYTLTYTALWLLQVQGESWKKLLLTLITAEELVDVFTLYGVDRYLTSSGLTVLAEHRGQNIGARLFEAR